MVGVLLAGGAGRRMQDPARGGGGSVVKAALPLGGRPLIGWPLAALDAVCDQVVVVAKRGSSLPALPGTERWDEPDEPRHPLVGIVHALEQAAAPVLVCAADMPFVTPDALRSLLGAAGGSGPGGGPAAAVAVSAGVLQPVLGVYAPPAAAILRAGLPDASLTATVEQLGPVRVALPERLTRSVNTRDELAAAADELAAAAARRSLGRGRHDDASPRHPVGGEGSGTSGSGRR